MKRVVALSSAFALASLVEAQQSEYYQCGGIGWTGSTTCVSPYVCTDLNPYYYQCLPGTGSTTVTTGTTTTTTATGSSTTTTTATSTTTLVPPAGTGFVSTVSSPSPHFELDGKPFYYGGTNAYYLPQLDTTADMVSVFETMNSLGLTVVRVWMFNEVLETQDYGAYYHLWDGETATFNLGPNGFDRMDETLALAEQYGVKVLLTLTNNWSDYGGSDVYVTQLGYTYHDDFYSEPTVIAAFKTYVDFVIDRYGDNSTVFAWELMNEPRCGGSSSSVPASSNCTSATLTAWVNEMSTYIHSIDSNHIVGVGDEGFFCWTNTTDYIYDCGTGGDSNSYSELSGVDFITFHMYPEGWGETSPNTTAWGQLWIEQHAYVQQASGKPAILEEFGIGEGDSTKVSVYGAWYDTVEEYKLGGVMYWQLGNDDAEVIDYTESDSNTIICPDYTETCPVVAANAVYMASLNT